MIYSLRPNWVSYLRLVMFTVIFSWPTAMSCLLWAIVARQLREHSGNLPLFASIISAATVPLGAIMAAYIINSFTFNITICENDIEVQSGLDNYIIQFEKIEKVSFLYGGRGWLYIGIQCFNDTIVITNAIYSDNTFRQIEQAITGWLQARGREELIYSGPNGPGMLGGRSFRQRHLSLCMSVVTVIAASAFIISWFLSPGH